uniref:Uncharacterized protein n=1 Tax=Timema cristinae TaxID=61476 RepID=A0A7R9DBM6_TIMCR|nr:unnamed protein product [Timema cristinae]
MDLIKTRLQIQGELAAVQEGLSSFSRQEPLLFHSRSSFHPHETELTLFQTHCFTESLKAPGIEIGTPESVARSSEH